MKKHLYKVAIIICIALIPSSTFAFIDIQKINRHYEAVKYLQEVGIINGYPDGSFKPDNAINRAEFLKLALLSSEIQTNTEQKSIFPDVKTDEWYSKYVLKAYSEGWIEGYPDGTFKPEQSINKVEAIKIIGKIQKWELEEKLTVKPFDDIKTNEWFAPYIAYGKEKNFIEEQSKNYIPDAHITRAQTSELLFRTFITKKSGLNYYSKDLVNDFPAYKYKIETSQNEEKLDFTFYTEDFFENIILTEKIPNTFYKNEFFTLKGEIKNGSFDTTFVFLSQNGNQTNTFSTKVINNKFEIKILFEETGIYKMGLITGEEGESKVIEINILNSIKPNIITTDQKPETPKITYKNGETCFEIEQNPNTIKILKLEQKNTEQNFLIRQNIKNICPNWKDYKNLEEGFINVSVLTTKADSNIPLTTTSDWTKSETINIQAVKHEYREINDKLIKYENLEEITDKIKEIKLDLIAQTDIQATSAIIKPNGLVEIIELNTNTKPDEYKGIKHITKNTPFTFIYTPEEKGTYILEINDINGSAVMNIPIYMANGIPIIPNFFDKYIHEENQILNLQTEINKQIELINKERNKFGLSNITEDKELSFLAQKHSNDMLERSFFGHINPEGQTPNDRRLNQNIQTPVGENLAIAPTSTYTINGLMQSAIHRKNILDPKWTVVGIGIAINEFSSMITTQEFSTKQITEEELKIIKTEILNQINKKRLEESNSILYINPKLEKIAEKWTNKMIKENFFAFTFDPTKNLESDSNTEYKSDSKSETKNTLNETKNTLNETIRSEIPTKMVHAIISESQNTESIIKELISDKEINNFGWKEVGIGLNIDKTGTFKLTILFSTD